MITRRTFLATSSIATLAIPALAQPTWSPRGRNVTLVIPFQPGGGADVAMRHVKEYAARQDIQIVPEYRSGADGLIAMRHTAGLPADGFNLAISTVGAMSHLREGFDALERLDPITGIRSHIFFVIVASNQGIENFDQLLDRLRDPTARTTGGAGAPGQKAAMDDLLSAAGVTNPFIASYRGAAGVIQDVSGGHITWGMVPGNVAVPAARGGLIKIVATDRRPGQPDTMPGVPSIFDRLPLYEKVDFTMTVMPRNAPAQVRDFWMSWFRRYHSDPEVVADLSRDHSTTVPFGPDHIRSSVLKWRERFGDLL